MPNPLTVEQFILQCSEISRHLDAISTRDDRRAIALALEQGRKDYESLRRQRDALLLAASEAPLIQIMLDGLLARLKFLEKQA